MGRLLVLGSINVDLTTHVRRHPAPGETVTGDGLDRFAGGKGANQAVSAARSGADVTMISAVGDDEGGRSYLRRLTGLGVDVSRVPVIEGTATGHALITVSDDGENSIVVIPGANAEVSADAVEQAAPGPGDVLLAVLEVPLEVVATAARAAHRAGARVVLNLAPYADLPADVIALADPVVVNEHEARQLDASGLTAPSLLITLGPAGARWTEEAVPGSAVPAGQVVDTTGAGDAFCGALAAALVAGADRASALAAGVAAGGAAVTHAGAQPDPRL
jgi:ribokinase